MKLSLLFAILEGFFLNCGLKGYAAKKMACKIVKKVSLQSESLAKICHIWPEIKHQLQAVYFNSILQEVSLTESQQSLDVLLQRLHFDLTCSAVRPMLNSNGRADCHFHKILRHMRLIFDAYEFAHYVYIFGSEEDNRLSNIACHLEFTGVA